MRLIWALMPMMAVVWAATVMMSEARDPCKQQPFMACRDISVISDERTTEHHKHILKELCHAGHAHRINLGHSEEQFAVFNIHGNKESNTAEWIEGGASNVACQPDWKLDANISMPTGVSRTGGGAYIWYSHGIPMWPILGQWMKCPGLSERILKRIFFCSDLKWPNYAIAMPMYLAKHECDNWRDPIIAMRKRFDLGENSTLKDKTFRVFAEKVMKNLTGEGRSECAEQVQVLEDYDKWLKPLISHSLKPMMNSAKKSLNGKCPAELYFFIRNGPQPSDLSMDLEDILRNVKCLRKTALVVGRRTSY